MASPFCPSCGAAQDPSNLFCPKCGHKLPPDGPAGQELQPPEDEAPNTTAGNAPSVQATMPDELWLRLQAEEQEYSRRSKRNARIGCLALLLLGGALVFLILYFGG